jgi:hypothetical protein
MRSQADEMSAKSQAESKLRRQGEHTAEPFPMIVTQPAPAKHRKTAAGTAEQRQNLRRNGAAAEEGGVHRQERQLIVACLIHTTTHHEHQRMAVTASTTR